MNDEMGLASVICLYRVALALALAFLRLLLVWTLPEKPKNLTPLLQTEFAIRVKRLRYAGLQEHAKERI